MLTAEQKSTIRSEIDNAWERIKDNLEILEADMAIIDSFEAALKNDTEIRPRLVAAKPDVDARDRKCAIQLVSNTREKPSS